MLKLISKRIKPPADIPYTEYTDPYLVDIILTLKREQDKENSKINNRPVFKEKK